MVVKNLDVNIMQNLSRITLVIHFGKGKNLCQFRVWWFHI